jgi:hypothetical protein
MPALTLNKAAKAAKKSKATILDAIQNGRLSAPKDELGRYQIDPSELFRVYPANDQGTGTENQNRPHEEPQETRVLLATIEHLRELLTRTERERDELGRRLDDEAEERRANASEIRRLTLLLTHQPPTASPPEQQQPAPPRRGPWAILAALIALAGGTAGGVYLLSQHGLLPLR